MLLAVESVVIHEVGHTLGLRHNFLACATGNTSVMDYHDDFDITADPEGAGRFGGQYLLAPAAYDVYAIQYGYTELAGEVRGKRHPALELLANGQPASDHLVLPLAHGRLAARI